VIDPARILRNQCKEVLIILLLGLLLGWVPDLGGLPERTDGSVFRDAEDLEATMEFKYWRIFQKLRRKRRDRFAHLPSPTGRGKGERR